MPADPPVPTSRRGLLIPTLTSVIVIAVLLSLGFWQLQRKEEKRVLIAALHERLAAEPVPLPAMAEWAKLTPARDEFRRVTFRATLETSSQAQVYTSGSALRKDIGRSGVWVFAPAALEAGGTVIVNRGFVDEGAQAPGPGAITETFAGYIRFAEQPSWVTPPADLGKRLWFLRDPKAMAEALGWGQAGPLAPFYIDLEVPVPAGGLPKPGPLSVHLKDDHLQYAITWFLLALAVSIAFAVWLRGRKRDARA